MAIMRERNRPAPTKCSWARTIVRLVALGGLTAVVLPACGGGHPQAAPSNTTMPAARPSVSSTTRVSTKTNARVTERLDKAIGEENKSEDAAAVADFLAVVKLDPANTVAWYDLGVIARQQDQNKQAISDYLHSLGGDPDYVPSLYNLAILETKANPTEAEGLYKRLLLIQPKNAAAHLNLGFVLLNEKRPGDARTQFDRAISIDQTLASRIPKAMGGTAS
jgi:tetratricopeptide (TPR) repeat protein